MQDTDDTQTYTIMYWLHAMSMHAKCLYAQALIRTTLSLLIMSPYMSAQYYGIENRTVAPYGYTENGEAFNLNEPPLLRALVEQNDEFGFDAVTREVFLSVTTHTCEL